MAISGCLSYHSYAYDWLWKLRPDPAIRGDRRSESTARHRKAFSTLLQQIKNLSKNANPQKLPFAWGRDQARALSWPVFHIQAKSWGVVKKPSICGNYGMFYVKEYSKQNLNLSYVPVEGNNNKWVIVSQTPLNTADLWLLLCKSESAVCLFRNIPALRFCSSSRENVVKMGTLHYCDTWLIIAI